MHSSSVQEVWSEVVSVVEFGGSSGNNNNITNKSNEHPETAEMSDDIDQHHREVALHSSINSTGSNNGNNNKVQFSVEDVSLLQAFVR